MLPPLKPDSPRLADVLRSCLGAVAASDNALGFSAVQKAIVVVIDGLGHMQLKAHSGHARFLAPASKPLVSGFPTTTASALASLATGASAGTHGIVGYDAFVPGVGVRNQLRDWGADMDPVAHQRSQPLWRDGCAVVSEAKHRSSGFTAAILRGAEYIGHDRLSNRVEAASEAARTHDVTYLYLPELDRLGHSGGVASDAWVSKLEEIDGLLADLAEANPDAGIAVTADHGMVDVPEDKHVLLDADDVPQLDGLAGEPRGRQLRLRDPAAAEAVAEELSDALGKTAWVASREELVDSGALGRVDPEVLPRLGDVFILSRGRHAHYFDEQDAARGMIGQHGSMTDDELLVPLIRLGAWRTGR